MEKLIKSEYRRQLEFHDLYKTLTTDYDPVAVDLIFENLKDQGKIKILSFINNEAHRFNVRFDDADVLIDMKPASKVAHLNDHFRAVNKELSESGIYLGCFENNIQSGKEKSINTGNVSGHSLIMKFQKSNATVEPEANKKLAFISYGHKTKKYSLAEMLGRLAFCGFEILNFKYLDNLIYFTARKKSSPLSEIDPKFKLIMQMKRVGKHGKIIGVYKFRTMYPYSEYIQDYVVKNNGYDAVGKPNKDFRVTGFGKVIRKIWIDEIPQFINILKGDMNIVGVRPITRFGLSNLSPELQIERLKYKPGLIPPNVALKLTGFNGVMKAEAKYLEEMRKHPLRTGIKYFFLAVYNILTFKAKSN